MEIIHNFISKIKHRIVSLFLYCVIKIIKYECIYNKDKDKRRFPTVNKYLY
jgi:hypothetical protein